MPERLKCPRCHEPFTATIDDDESRVVCPECGHRFVPNADDREPPRRSTRDDRDDRAYRDAPRPRRGPSAVLPMGLLAQAFSHGLQLMALIVWLAFLAYQLSPTSTGSGGGGVWMEAWGTVLLVLLLVGVGLLGLLNLVAGCYFALSRDVERSRPLGLAVLILVFLQMWLMAGLMSPATMMYFDRSDGFGPRGGPGSYYAMMSFGLAISLWVLEALRITIQGFYLSAVAYDVRSWEEASGLAVATPLLLLLPWLFALIIPQASSPPARTRSSGDDYSPYLILGMFFFCTLVIQIWSLVVLLGLLAGDWPGRPTDKEPGMHLGFVSAILPDLSLEEVLAFARDEGFSCVELMCWPPGEAERRYAGVTHLDVGGQLAERVRQARDLTHKYGVSISGLGYYPNPLDADAEHRRYVADHLRKVMDAAAALGVGVVNTFIGRNPRLTVEENWPLLREVWHPLVKHADDLGLKIGIENCPMLFSNDEWPGGKNLAMSPSIWRRLFDELASANVGLNFDPSHLVWLMIDAGRAIREFGPRIYHFHAKDVRIDRERLYQEGVMGLGWEKPKLPGLGDVDWPGVFAALTDVGYRGPVCIEVEDRAYEGSLADRKRALRQSKRFLEQWV